MRRAVVVFTAGVLGNATLSGAALVGPAESEAQEVPDSALVDVVATGLEVVWAMAEAPDGRIFITERLGRVRTITNGVLEEAPWAELTVHTADGHEAGLMGLAVDPDFTANGYVYLCYSVQAGPEQVENRVVRMRDTRGVGVDDTVLVDHIPGGAYHNGCALGFGPDDKLYISTGDAYDRSTPQDSSSLGGKILRINRDGSYPLDNPLPHSPVWAMGLRNPQGFGWDPSTGLMFSTEHGTQGINEINVIRPGSNYGWPISPNEHQLPEFTPPLLVHDVPPAGLTFVTGDRYPDLEGNLIFAGLGLGSLTRVVLRGGSDPRVLRIQTLLDTDFGRIRAIMQASDGYLYIATSNRDGRGDPTAEDDRLLRIRAFVR